MVHLTEGLFKRLVRLYLLAIFVSILAMAFELVVFPGFELYDEVDRLTAAYYAPLVHEDIWLPIIGLSLVMSVTGAFGLLRLKKWGRPLFVWPPLIVAVVDVVILSEPILFTPLLSLITFVLSALFGAIVLLAYSRKHGGVWFGDDVEKAGE